MLRRYLYLMVTCLSFSLSAQRTALVNTGSVSQSLGGITTTLDESDAILSNFSALSPHYSNGLVLAAESRFGFSELTAVGLAGYIKTGENGAVGLRLSNYGFEAYNEQTISGLYRRQLGQNIAGSIELGFYQLSLNEFGSAQKPFYRIGLSGKITSQLNYGLILSNLEAAQLIDNTTLMSSLAFGLAYKVSPKINIRIEMAKELETILNVKVGISYQPHPKFELRIGSRTASGQSGGGFSYQLSDKLNLEGHVLYHPVLGTTPGVGIKYQNSQQDKSKRSKR
jgi:hypothetical protein